MLGTNDPFDVFHLKILEKKLSASQSSLPFSAGHNAASLGLFCVGPSSATVVVTLYFSACVCQSGRRQEILVTLTAAAPFPPSPPPMTSVGFGDTRSGTEPQ